MRFIPKWTYAWCPRYFQTACQFLENLMSRSRLKFTNCIGNHSLFHALGLWWAYEFLRKYTQKSTQLPLKFKLTSSCSFLIRWKMYSKLRGITPLRSCCKFSAFSAGPNIVNVFPEPVWPLFGRGIRTKYWYIVLVKETPAIYPVL